MNQENETPEEVIFTTDDGEEVTFSDLLKTVYTNSRTRANSIVQTAQRCSQFITDPSSAVLMLPNFTALNNSAIKNDDALLLMANIIEKRRTKSKQTDNDATGNDALLSDSDRKMLIEQAKQYAKPRASAHPKTDS
jgi:hypothetical protein